jgi:hypothetical protein
MDFVCRLQNYELLSQHDRTNKAINVKKKKKGIGYTALSQIKIVPLQSHFAK